MVIEKMERTLYLNENKALKVIRDGPSVWVKEEGKAGSRVPARLIGRVVIIGNVKIESGVITLFTDRNIPVTFINYRGESVAVALPYNDKLPRHYEDQKIFLKNEQNILRFKNWLESRRKEIQLNVVKRLSKRILFKFTRFGFREKDYRNIINQFRKCSLEQWQVVTVIISNLLREMIIGSLIRADLDPHMGVLHRRHNFSLALDLCYILEAEIDIQSLQFLKQKIENERLIKENKNWCVSKEGMRDIIHRFENRKNQLTNITEQLIDDIFEMMRELRK